MGHDALSPVSGVPPDQCSWASPSPPSHIGSSRGHRGQDPCRACLCWTGEPCYSPQVNQVEMSLGSRSDLHPRWVDPPLRRPHPSEPLAGPAIELQGCTLVCDCDDHTLCEADILEGLVFDATSPTSTPTASPSVPHHRSSCSPAPLRKVLLWSTWPCLHSTLASPASPTGRIPSAVLVPLTLGSSTTLLPCITHIALFSFGTCPSRPSSEWPNFCALGILECSGREMDLGPDWATVWIRPVTLLAGLE